MARRSLRVLFTAVTSAVAITLGAAPSHAAEKIPEGDLPQALVNYVASPDAVAGANDWSCKPSKDKPHPVVLLPGTFFNIGVNFVKIAPRLHNEGYCVFATNYGMTSVSLGRVGGLKHIPESAKELDAFVDKVLRATGAEKVDIIGHSQGGNVPMYWMKKMGNAHKVAHYVGWAPSSHGTSVDGVVTLAHKLRLLGFAMPIAEVGQIPGVLDQFYTSDYTKELWADGPEVPVGPKYTVIMSRYDVVVTPYETQKLSGRDVNNVVLQERCPQDPAGHVGLFNDEPTMQLTLNALADGPKNFQPECRGYGLPVL
jgi:hypothetical protein